MTNSIRPTGPGAGTGLDALGESLSNAPDALREGAGTPGGAEQAGSAAASQAAQASQAAAGGAAATGTGGAARVLAELQAGHIDREQAIEALVTQALAEPHVARLSTAKRAELAGVLRAALSDDPRLGALLGG